MIFFNTDKPNVETVTQKLIKALGVKVNDETVFSLLQEHPDYPSMLAISDCLNELDVSNSVLFIDKLEYCKENLIQLLPFVAHLQEQRGERLMLVSEIKDNTFIVQETGNNLVIISENEFLSVWTGIILCAEAHEKSGEKGYLINKIGLWLKKLTLPVAFLTLLGLLNTKILNDEFTLYSISLILFKFIGLFISIILILQVIDLDNPLIKRFCAVTGKSDCGDLLSSKAAKITPWLSWSEVGLFYFGSTLLIVLIYPKEHAIIAITNILALPYSFFSIGYQYKKNTWCPLCCAIQVLLWAEFCLNLYRGHFTIFQTFVISNGNQHLATIIACFFLPILAWGFLRPFFERANKLHVVEKQLNRFKYNEELFSQVLSNQEYFHVEETLTNTVLGNKEAENVITMVTSPFCETCSKAHSILDDWLKETKNIQLKIVFATDASERDPRTAIARHILALSRQNDMNIVRMAIKDWYEQGTKKYEAWSLNYPTELEDNLDEIILAQKNWCELLDIQETPVLLINGYRMPQAYSIKDLQYFFR